MKHVSDFLKQLRIFTVCLYFDTNDGTTCIRKHSVCMPLSSIGIMASERDRASSYLPCGFRIRTSVTNLDVTELTDVRSFFHFMSSYLCESTSDFRYMFKEIHRTAIHYIDG